MKYGVLYMPKFALQAVLRIESLPSESVVVIVAAASRKTVVLEMTEPARRAGIMEGMLVSQAAARSPGVIVRCRSKDAERSAAKAILTCAYTLSPRVEETDKGICTIDLRGASGESLLSRGEDLLRQIEELGFRGRIGFSETPRLAYFAAYYARPILVVAARDREEFLNQSALRTAGISEKMAMILQQWGIRTLGAYSVLPREDVGRRLGKEGLTLWDELAGREERHLVIAKLPEGFEESLELEYEIETMEPLLFILRRFLESLTLRLKLVYLVVGLLHLTLTLSNGSVYRRLFKILEPTREVETLFRMLFAHLENVETESPITAVSIRINPVSPQLRQCDLFETALKNPQRLSATLARLVGVVGTGRVGTPRLRNTYRSDSFCLEPIPAVLQEIEDGPPKAVYGLPLRRLRPSVQAQVKLENGRPRFISSQFVRGRITSEFGPWQSSGGWWEKEGWAREEWDVELEKEGLYRIAREDGKWFVEGMYD